MILTQSIIHYRFWFNSSKIFADLGSKNQYDGSLHVNDTYLTWFDTSMVIELPPLFAYFVRAQHFVEPLNDAKDSARRTEGLTECHGAKRREHYTRITLLHPSPPLLSLCRLFRRPFRCRSALLCALAAIAARLPSYQWSPKVFSSSVLRVSPPSRLKGLPRLILTELCVLCRHEM